MSQQIEKLLEFNGIVILSVVKNGVYWIALQSACEALNKNYDEEYQNLKASKVFIDDFADLQVPVPGEEERILICLKESSIYGWIFTIPGDKSDFIIRRKKFNDTLFNYCRSNITRRMKLFEEKAKIQIKRNKLEIELRANDKFVELENLKAREARLGNELKIVSKIELNEQLEFFTEIS